MKILFLGANPLNTPRLRIPRELRGVQEEIKGATNVEAIEIHSELAVQSNDLSRLLLDTRPNIVHFSGHGMLRMHQPASSGTTRDFGPRNDDAPREKPAESAILFENNAGKAVPVPPEALTALFGILKTQRCIVLNACFSSEQAQALTKHVDCVIGMKRAIDDESAITFASGFYQALVRGKSVKEAFDLGKTLIAMCSLPDADVPELHTKDGMDADTVRFVQSAENTSMPLPPPLPEPTPKPPKPLPKYLAPGLFGLFVAAVVVLCVIRAWPLQIPNISSTSRTIVVVGPGGFRAEGQRLAESLCVALDTTAKDEPRAFCGALGYGDEENVVRNKAIEAKASVLVVVDDGGKGRIYPLKGFANHDRLAQGLPSVDLSNSGAPNALAPVLHELARAADGEKDAVFDKNRLRCGQSLVQEPFGVAFTIMVLRLDVPNCLTVETDIDTFRSRCRGEECTMLDMLDTKPKPLPENCDQKSDPGEQLACKHKQALAVCENGEKDATKKWIASFDAVPNLFNGMIASEIAACLVTHGRGLSSEEKKAFEARDDKLEPGCEASTCNAADGQCNFCAFTIAVRAKYWAEARDWKRAERDYERAYRTSKDNEHLLGMVESRLYQFKDVAGDVLAKKLDDDLKAMVTTSIEQTIRVEFLRWVAAKREANKTYITAAERSLVNAYGKLPEGASVYVRDKPDAAERGLVCPSNAKTCPVYDLLAVPKDAGTADKLREALRATVLPEGLEH